MKLTIDELRPLVASPEDIPKHLPLLQRVQALDLSNGGIVGDQIADLLQFISLSASPVSLQSIDVGSNRLGDVGAIALARFLQASANNLPSLEALDLSANCIRDEGALALVNAIREQANVGKLLLLKSVTLHDNDICETVLQALGAIWTEIPMNRVLGWKRTALPDESGCQEFAKLLKREIDLVKAKHVAAVAEKLEALSTFLKRILWHAVTCEGMTGQKLVLRVFPALNGKFDIFNMIRVGNVITDPQGNRMTVRDFIDTSPKLQEYMAMNEPEREKSFRVMCQRAIEHCDPQGLVLPLAARAEDMEKELINGLLDQFVTLHAVVTDAKATMDSFPFNGNKNLLSTALSSSLGLPATISPTTRNWLVARPHVFWDIEGGRKVQVFPDVQPFVEVTGVNKSGRLNTPTKNAPYSEVGYVLTCELPN